MSAPRKSTAAPPLKLITICHVQIVGRLPSRRVFIKAQQKAA
jgi:hypothetical protein